MQSIFVKAQQAKDSTSRTEGRRAPMQGFVLYLFIEKLKRKFREDGIDVRKIKIIETKLFQVIF